MIAVRSSVGSPPVGAPRSTRARSSWMAAHRSSSSRLRFPARPVRRGSASSPSCWKTWNPRNGSRKRAASCPPSPSTPRRPSSGSMSRVAPRTSIAAKPSARSRPASPTSFGIRYLGFSSAAQLLRFRAREDPVMEKNVGRILREVERLNRMVATLMEFGRPHCPEDSRTDPDVVWDDVLATERGRPREPRDRRATHAAKDSCRVVDRRRAARAGVPQPAVQRGRSGTGGFGHEPSVRLASERRLALPPHERWRTRFLPRCCLASSSRSCPRSREAPASAWHSPSGSSMSTVGPSPSRARARPGRP